ncbi:unnamed protein product [Cunninghamella blakesleeana]
MITMFQGFIQLIKNHFFIIKHNILANESFRKTGESKWLYKDYYHKVGGDLFEREYRVKDAYVSGDRSISEVDYQGFLLFHKKSSSFRFENFINPFSLMGDYYVFLT